MADGRGADHPGPDQAAGIAVRVSISYAHDDRVHEDRVRGFWRFLRENGVDARADMSAAERRQDWAEWMTRQVRDATYVLVIASPEYRRRAEGNAGPGEGGGVQWEARLIRDLFYAGQQAGLQRFLPVVLPGCSADGIPLWLGPASTTHYIVGEYTVAGADKLLRLLTGQPWETDPPVGPVPVLPPRYPGMADLGGAEGAAPGYAVQRALPTGTAAFTGRGGRSLDQLERDVPNFVGRSSEIDQLQRFLLAAGAPGQCGPPVAVVAGMPGMGKTALATHVAFLLREQFPFQIPVSLGGTGVPARDPSEVLDGLLRRLGVPADEIPVDHDDRAALYRDKLAALRVRDGRSALLILDNAVTESQVRPLLPGSGGCAVMITSRYQLTQLEGAARIRLGGVGMAEAVELLAATVGQERVDAAPEAAEMIARGCGLLPLALCITARNLTSPLKARQPLDRFAQRFKSEQQRLDLLRGGQDAVETSFALSYQELPAEQAELFRALGTLEVPDTDIQVAAALIDRGADATEDLLDGLASSHLVEIIEPSGRFRLHDLLRLHARRRARADEQRAVLGRAFRWYLDQTASAAAWLDPRAADARRGSITEAVLWLDAERHNLVAAIVQAAERDFGTLASQLALALAPFLDEEAYLDDWLRVSELALGCARRTRDERAQAISAIQAGAAAAARNPQDSTWQSLIDEALASLRRLGEAEAYADGLGRLAEACRARGLIEPGVSAARQSLAEWRRLGDQRGEAKALMLLGVMNSWQLLFDQAMTCLEQSRSIWSDVGDGHSEAQVLRQMGAVDRMRAHLVEAIGSLESARTISATLGDRVGEADSLDLLGSILRQYHLTARARAACAESRAIWGLIGDPRRESRTLAQLAGIAREQGLYEEAFGNLEQWLARTRETGDPGGELPVLAAQGTTYQAQGRYPRAFACFKDRLDKARGTGADEEGAALNDLGLAYLEQGQAAHAQKCFEEYARIAGSSDTWSQLEAWHGLADVHRERVRYGQAAALLEKGIDVYAGRQDRSGESWEWRLLGDLYLEAERFGEAMRAYEKQLQIRREMKDPYRQGWALVDIADVHRARGDREAQLAVLREGLELRRASGNRYGVGQMHAGIALAFIEQRRFAEADDHIQQMDAVFGELGLTTEPSCRQPIACAFASGYRFEEAIAHFERLLEDLGGNGAIQASLDVVVDLAHVHQRAGQPRTAVALLSQALSGSRDRGDRAGELRIDYEFSVLFRNQRRTSRAIAYGEAGLAIAREEEALAWQIELLRNQASLATLRRRFDDAICFYAESLELCQATGNLALEGKVLSDLGRIYRDAGQYDKSADSFERSMRIRQELDDQHNRAYLLADIAGMYGMANDPVRALSLLEDSLSIAAGLESAEHAMTLHGEAARVLTSLGEPDLALEHLTQKITTCRHLGRRDSEGWTLSDFAETHLKAARPREAIACYEQNLCIRRELGDAQGTAQVLTDLAEVSAQAGEPGTALDHLNESLAICELREDIAGQADAHRMIGQVSQENKQTEAAVLAYTRALLLYRDLDDTANEHDVLASLDNITISNHETEGPHQQESASEG
jgi:tetratricopeptide (TPR) repeat protein